MKGLYEKTGITKNEEDLNQVVKVSDNTANQEEILKELKSKSVEEICNDLYGYLINEFKSPDKIIGFYRVIDLFWESKGTITK
ncbi:hypothetical protein Metvu_0142 [Methanocaldococcus vulcanius M7]|uniref:Uncharacterized protein n=1 Tax=Methanocaldococcus vulcanius (strain ATCC 700851 / DSM 12094 / M7) TaxID=579137 RepID=C9REK8_METVM|nr:hypothetical protein Metvu_0142 [Methanocaldococcus vulcanius M7]